MSPTPLVGLSTYDTEATWSGRHEPAALLPMSYIGHVARAGGAPVLLPPIGRAGAVVERLDALVVTGGPDVDPARYGATRHRETQPSHPERDRFEAELLAAAAEHGLPTLCICRGAQLLNVVRGGTLHQHLPDLVGSHAHDPNGDVFADTAVRIEPTSRLASQLATTAATVACHHHQAVDRLGDGLVAVAWADDGTVEALEDPTMPSLFAVQWHPEERDDPTLFAWLVGAAERSGARSG